MLAAGNLCFEDGASKAEMKKRTKPQNKGDWGGQRKHCNLLVTQCQRGKGQRTLMSLMTVVFKRVLFSGKAARWLALL